MKTKIAKDLLKIQAVFLRPDEPFTWASGIKSPIYCDNRLTLSDHQVRLDVENGLAELVKTHYPEAEALMGTSTAGIAHAAITAHLLALPMGYVRSGAKDHGRKNQIEGKLVPGQKVVVIEDLISTGGSVLEVVEVLRQAGHCQHFYLWNAKECGTPGRGSGEKREPDRPGHGGPSGGGRGVYPDRRPGAAAGFPGQPLRYPLDSEVTGWHSLVYVLP